MSTRALPMIEADLAALRPPGWALPRSSDSDFGKIAGAMAKGIFDVETAADGMIDEIDPRTASWMLGDFERVLGPDVFGRDAATLRGVTRNLAAAQRWVARGGASIAYFVSLAAAMGISVTIQNVIPGQCDDIQCGDEITPISQRYCWIVTLAATNAWDPEAGVEQAGDPLGGFDPSLIEAVFNFYKPAHTQPVFSYF